MWILLLEAGIRAWNILPSYRAGDCVGVVGFIPALQGGVFSLNFQVGRDSADRSRSRVNCGTAVVGNYRTHLYRCVHVDPWQARGRLYRVHLFHSTKGSPHRFGSFTPHSSQRGSSRHQHDIFYLRSNRTVPVAEFSRFSSVEQLRHRSPWYT